jgi:hypothetical protein
VDFGTTVGFRTSATVNPATRHRSGRRRHHRVTVTLRSDLRRRWATTTLNWLVETKSAPSLD